MRRWVAAGLVLCGCLGGEETLESYCAHAPEICFGAKGPYGSATGDGTVTGASDGPGINVLRAAVGDACDGVPPLGATAELRAECDGQLTCAASADFLYFDGDPFPHCDEQLVVSYRCSGGAQRRIAVTDSPWWTVKLACE